MAPQEASYRLAVDVGGTFTDFVLLDHASGVIRVAKSLTTPADPSAGVLKGVKAFDGECGDHVAATRRIAHATTLIANAVIERKGARTALLTTKGFRDVLEFRRHVRVTTYELWADPPEPLVPRHLRIPIDERTFSDGAILKPLPEGEIAEAVETMRAEGVTSIAVAFLHSYVNPANEQRAGALLEKLAPEMSVTLSSDVLPQLKEFERSSTTVVNGYVKPLARHYLDNLEAGLRRTGYEAPLHIMLSNGGLGSKDTAGAFPIRLIESGPVAGAIVGCQLAELLDLGEVLSYDMGGTTAKACLIRDRALPITDELEVARSKRFTKSSGFPIGVPAVNMIEIGAGGGSIAAVNRLGLVQVGPESAGADPGPVCYGGGGADPTVTDADLILGYLDPDNFAGGSIRLDTDAAATQLERKIAQPQDRDPIAAAWTVHDVINETMAAAVRMHVTERGGNPQAATMVAFGGAGPVHAYNLARKLRMSSIIVPLRAGVLSAEGLLMAPPAYDIVRTHKVPLTEFDPAGTDAAMDSMAEEIGRQLDGVGTTGDRQFTRSVDVGYIGQSYQVTVPLEPGMDRDAIFSRFAQLYRQKYGYFYDDVPAEVVSIRVLGEILGGGLKLEPLANADDETPPAGGQRQAYSPRRQAMVAFTVFDRAALRPGMRFPGPAIVEEPTATTIIDEDGHVDVDRFGSLVISLGDQTP